MTVSVSLTLLWLASVHIAVHMACENTVNICGNTMFDEIQAADGDNAIICASVDRALECVARETVSCDLLTKADILSAMNGMINLYTGPPYNCTLANAEDSVFDDSCSGPLSACNVLYYGAEFAVTLTESCVGFASYLDCMRTNTSACDASSQAVIEEAMDNATLKMNTPPYSCNKTNANEACASQLYDCNIIYSNIELAPTATLACQGFDNYLDCMSNLTCDATTQVSNDESIERATSRMNAAPYHCDERELYNITACETGFYACVDPLNAIGTSNAQTSNEVCNVINAFMQCAADNNVVCSPRLQAEYQMSADNLTNTFKGDPYYCGAENPCMEVFKGCNTSELNLRPASGCGLIEVYDACIGAVTPICDADKFALTQTEVGKLKQQIEIDFKCSTSVVSTTPSATTSESTAQPTTAPATTAPPTTAPDSTAPPTTAPATTMPSTTAQESTTAPATTTSSVTTAEESTSRATQPARTTSPTQTSTPNFDQIYGNNGAAKNSFSAMLVVIMTLLFVSLM